MSEVVRLQPFTTGIFNWPGWSTKLGGVECFWAWGPYGLIGPRDTANAVIGDLGAIVDRYWELFHKQTELVIDRIEREGRTIIADEFYKERTDRFEARHRARIKFFERVPPFEIEEMPALTENGRVWIVITDAGEKFAATVNYMLIEEDFFEPQDAVDRINEIYADRPPPP